MRQKMPLGLWRPSTQTVEAIATVLCSHWATAGKAAMQSPFWPKRTNWLDRQTTRLSGTRIFSAHGLMR